MRKLKNLKKVTITYYLDSRKDAQEAGMPYWARTLGYYGSHECFIERGSGGDNCEITGWVNSQDELVVLYDHNWEKLVVLTNKGMIRIERIYACTPIRIDVLEVNEKFVDIFIHNKFGEHRRIYFDFYKNLFIGYYDATTASFCERKRSPFSSKKTLDEILEEKTNQSFPVRR